VFTPSHGEGVPSGILSLTADPLYGDAYAEVRGNNGVIYVLHIRGDDFSVRNLYDVGEDMYGAGKGLPMAITGEGRLSLEGHEHLMRIVPTIDGDPSFQEWDISP
jgi:hypothetical protein